ncbi:phosphatase inhibitor-domain-containing protein [Ganoderma leucocontextum]|nr:phosphatase inhibitor-domain-containing protein [Ganoderma leucocontextum]
MSTRQARRPNTPAPSDGSRTIIVHDDQPREDDNSDTQSMGTLRLRGAPRHRQRVVWREDVVDNEGAGKKKSKICCIYHKPREFDESSSSESSDSDSEPDSDAAARRRCNHDHDHDHNDVDGGHSTSSRNEEGGGAVHELESDEDDVNAYERRPRRKPMNGQDTNS